MQLARAVAARALIDWAQPEESAPAAEPQDNNPEPQDNNAEPQDNNAEPEPSPTPEPPANPTPATARLRTAGTYLRAPTCKPIDPALLFTRLAATVRDCIALEARLAAGTAPPSFTLLADPRHASLREIFRVVTENLPDRAGLLRETTTQLNETLAADPNHTIKLREILFTICDDLGIDIDFATLPSEYLDLIADTEIIDAEIDDPPDPCATSPP
jgi:hypothetical protein